MVTVFVIVMVCSNRKIENKRQVELPDCWLKYGNVWEVWKPQHSVEVKFGGSVDLYMDHMGKFHTNHNPDFVVRAVPYDEPIVGYHSKDKQTHYAYGMQKLMKRA